MPNGSGRNTMSQLNIFGEEPEDKKQTNETDWGKIDKMLNQLSKEADRTLKLTQAMLDEVQKGWTEEEKENIRVQSDPNYKRKFKLETTMTTELKESLLKCRIEGNRLYLPSKEQGELKNYSEVRQALLNAGAKYKRNTFVFPSDAQPYIDRLTGGEKVNIKKEFQFFSTPEKLADYLVELAEIKFEHDILEPSAGQGAIIHAIQREIAGNEVWGYELMENNQKVLEKITNFKLLGSDFLTECDTSFDRIIANPPFNKNQDIDHIRKMYEVCKPGGRIVSVASNSWKIGNQKKQILFQNWLRELGAKIEEVEAGAFKESGTMTTSCIIVINK